MSTTETIMRGYRLRLDASSRQKALLDTWRNRARSLWNLLLSLEMAAYSGDRAVRAELKWRQIWVEVVQENYQRDLLLWENGRSGKRLKLPGKGNEAKIVALQEHLQGLKKGTVEFRKTWRELNQFALKPERPSQEYLDKIRGKIEEPKLFIWKRDLLAIVARLKRVGSTSWIGDLPSHAAQVVAKDMEKAIQAMLRERKKRAAGNGRNTGFPRFKKPRYADGAVYFANTQITLNLEAGWIRLSNDIGKMRYFSDAERTNSVLPSSEKRAPELMCAGRHAPYFCRTDRRMIFKKGKAIGTGRRCFAERIAGGTLLGGRAFRQGEEWWISLQFKLPKPDPLPSTGKMVGVKIAAAVPLTTFDGSRWRQVDLPKQDEEKTKQYKMLAQSASRKLEAKKKKERKFLEKQERLGKPLRKKRFRLRSSKAYFKTAAAMAEIAAIDRRGYDKLIHNETTKIVRNYDVIATQNMDVASLMRKPQQERRRKRREENGQTRKELRRSVKIVRKIMQRAAMARWRQVLEYKAIDFGRIYEETEREFKEVQTTLCCGEVHPEMRDGRLYLRCDRHGTIYERRKNAAVHEFRRTLKAKEIKCSPDV